MRNLISTTAMILAFVGISAPAFAQDEPVSELYTLVSDLKRDNAELKELLEHQNGFLSLLKVDPAEAAEARLPFSECAKTVLADYCPALRLIYADSE